MQTIFRQIARCPFPFPGALWSGWLVRFLFGNAIRSGFLRDSLCSGQFRSEWNQISCAFITVVPPHFGIGGELPWHFTEFLSGQLRRLFRSFKYGQSSRYTAVRSVSLQSRHRSDAKDSCARPMPGLVFAIFGYAIFCPYLIYANFIKLHVNPKLR